MVCMSNSLLHYIVFIASVVIRTPIALVATVTFFQVNGLFTCCCISVFYLDMSLCKLSDCTVDLAIALLKKFWWLLFSWESSGFLDHFLYWLSLMCFVSTYSTYEYSFFFVAYILSGFRPSAPYTTFGLFWLSPVLTLHFGLPPIWSGCLVDPSFYCLAHEAYCFCLSVMWAGFHIHFPCVCIFCFLYVFICC